MKEKAFKLIAVENGVNEEVAESNSEKRLINRAIKEVRALASVFDGSTTWFVIETATDKIWFHAGTGNPERL